MYVNLLLILSLLWGAMVLLFLFAIGRTYFFRELLLQSRECTQPLPLITLIIPARNEEHNIGICLEGIRALDYPPERLQVIVVNDGSTDATREVVVRYMQQMPQLQLLDATALPEGWMGKAHGCWLGSQQARGEWLAFIDADTYVKPALLHSAVAFVQQRDTELLSVIPFQVIHSRQERLWLPGLFLGIAASVNFRRVNDPDDPYSLANGQFLMFRRDAYERIGGHHAIRGEISDDLAFAARAKHHRLRFYCLFGDGLIETRMYRNLAEIWRGFSKNLAEIMFAASWPAVVLHALRSCAVGLGFMVLPPLLLCSAWIAGEPVSAITAGVVALGGATLLITFSAVARELRMPQRYSLLMALGLLLHALLIINSFRQKQLRRREWKGRHYSF